MDIPNNSRKMEHLLGALDFWRKPPSNSFDFIKFVHNALPEINLDEISTRVQFLGHTFDYPLHITAMTGGIPEVTGINHVLGQVAAKYNIPVEVGSQRAALENPKLAKTFSAVRDEGLKAFIIGNIGMTQIRDSSDPVQLVQNCIDMIHADAISIHLNVVQELLQPEGNRKFSGVEKKIKEIVARAPVPVLVKEVGSGISGPVASALEKAGVPCINVAGSGGTNFNEIEYARNSQFNDKLARTTNTENGNYCPPWGDLLQWGIPTVVALKWVRASTSLPLIGSGGIRSGVDLAKVLCLGGSIGGICGALLPALFTNGHFPSKKTDLDAALERLTIFLDRFLLQFKITLNCIGISSIKDLQKVPLMFFGPVKEWLDNLKLLP